MMKLTRIAAWAWPALISTVVWVMVTGPAVVLVAAVACVLATGAGERHAARVLMCSRPLDDLEKAALADVVTRLTSHGYGPPGIEVRVARMLPWATAFGRRTLVLSQDLVDAVIFDRIPEQEVLAIATHAAAASREGGSRWGGGSALYLAPWRLLDAMLAAPRRGILGTAWSLRWIVLVVAVIQNHQRPIAAAAISVVGALTYVSPAADAACTRELEDRGDIALVELGLGRVLAGVLRRQPAQRRLVERVRVLEQAPKRPRLRLVS